MHHARKPVTPDEDLLGILKEWGWRNPIPEMLRVAQQARDAKTMKSAEFLTALGIITPDQAKRLLATKPIGIQTISWISQQDDIAVPVDRVLALMNGYAFYEYLSILTIHPCMQMAEITKYAEELDAAIMLIEDALPVVVFSTFAALLKFRSLGRVERMHNGILRIIGDDPLTAVGARDEISAVLKSVRSDDTSGSLESANVWNAEAAENKIKPENREITRLLDHAMKLNATDVSLKPFRSGEILVQLRKFGQMISPKVVSAKMNTELGAKVISLLQTKSASNPTGSEQRIPSDGQITYRSAAGDAFLRLSFIPLNHLGELRNLTSVSIRLLPRAESSVSLEDLHLRREVVDQIHFAMQMSQGLVLIVGPTNSGKSTTVAGCIGEHVRIFGDTQKRLGVEDPIERFQYGITQINAPAINNKTVRHEDERFGIILRAIKRHDPDMINIGEVRDKETADLCVATASTGHLVLSTLHANHTVMGFDVLAKTVPPDKRFQLVESISLIISQRLVKVLCPECRIVRDASDEDHATFSRYLKLIGEEGDLPENLASANPGGCESCSNDGYIGMAPINEVLPFTRDVKDAAIEMLVGEQKRRVLSEARTLTLLQSGLQLLGEHQIALTELLV